MAHLDATRDQFAANVARAKSRLHISEAGVLAGPVASQR